MSKLNRSTSRSNKRNGYDNMTKHYELNTAQDYANEIVKLFNSIAGKYSAIELFDDWLEGQTSYLNSVTGLDYARYRQYLIKSHKEHTNEMNDTYNKVDELLQEGLTRIREDILGIVYMQMKPNKEYGQFFTPFDICDLMARIVTDEETVKKEIDENGFFVVADQCCGSGATMIAQVEYLLSLGIDIDHIKVMAGDIDDRCAQMTAIQLCLLDYDAEILRQDALLLDEPYVYSTLRHALNEKGIEYLQVCQLITLIQITAPDNDFSSKSA